MVMNLDSQSRTLAEMFADTADVFSESVDDDALHSLASNYLEISGFSIGTVTLLGASETVLRSVAVTPNGERPSFLHTEEPTQLTLRSTQTLKPEFAVTNNRESLFYEYAFPLRVRGLALGAVHIMADHVEPLDEAIVCVLQCMADLAASAIDQTHHVTQSRSLVTQLQGALDSRVIIEQAKGILAERMRIDPPSAFQRIRAIARREQRSIQNVATEIVANLQVRT